MSGTEQVELLQQRLKQLEVSRSQGGNSQDVNSQDVNSQDVNSQNSNFPQSSNLLDLNADATNLGGLEGGAEDAVGDAESELGEKAGIQSWTQARVQALAQTQFQVQSELLQRYRQLQVQHTALQHQHQVLEQKHQALEQEHLTFQAQAQQTYQQNRSIEAVLFDSWDVLEAIVQGIGTGICVFDRHGALLHGNSAACELLGLDSVESLLGLGSLDQLVARFDWVSEQGYSLGRDDLEGLDLQDWADVSPATPGVAVRSGSGEDFRADPVDLDPVALAQAVPTCTSPILGYRRSPEADWSWLRMQSTPAYDRQGHLRYGILTLEDMTDYKRNEQLLYQQATMFRALFNGLQESVLLLDRDGMILEANPTAAQRLEVSLAQLPGSFLCEHCAPDVRKQRQRWLKQVVKSRAPIYGQETQQERHLNISLWPCLDLQGEVSQVVLLGYEVTQQKRLEADLQQKRELLQLIFDNIPIMLTFYDPQTDETLVNGEWERVMGWTMEELEGRDQFQEFYPDPQYRKMVVDFIQQENRAWRDFQTQVRSGQQLDTCWANVKLSDGCIIGIGQDVTARKRQEQQLQHQLAQEHLLSSVAQYIHACSNLEDILNHVTQTVRQFMDLDRVVLYRLEEDGSGSIVAESCAAEYPMMQDWLFSEIYCLDYLQEQTAPESGFGVNTKVRTQAAASAKASSQIYVDGIRVQTLDQFEAQPGDQAWAQPLDPVSDELLEPSSLEPSLDEFLDPALARAIDQSSDPSVDPAGFPGSGGSPGFPGFPSPGDAQAQPQASAPAPAQSSVQSSAQCDPSCLSAATCDPVDPPAQCTYPVLAISNLDHAFLAPEHRELLRFFKVRAKLVIPIGQGGECWGAMSLHVCRGPRNWEASEIRMLQRLAVQMGIAIHQAKLYETLREANDRLSRQALLDGLTGIANRRHFDDYLKQEWQRAFREQEPLSLILCDIDFFKAFNDRYGHPAGDTCLRQVARFIQGQVHRSLDLVARYGGEEFAIILPNTDLSGAKRLAQTICSTVRGERITHAGAAISANITLSLGVATLIPQSYLQPAHLIEAADQALYKAKQLGRDQVRVARGF
ncbi:MAG: diguanylate cyclase [Prochlorothrix sp.]